MSHRNGFRAEYSGRNLAEYSAKTVSAKIMGFSNFAEYSFIAEHSVILPNIRQFYRIFGKITENVDWHWQSNMCQWVKDSVNLPNVRLNHRIFGKITEYSATNKQLPNIRFQPNIRCFLVTEGSYSAETRQSCFGDSLQLVYNVQAHAYSALHFHRPSAFGSLRGCIDRVK